MERVIPNETTTTARIPDAKVRQAISARNEKTRRVKEMDAPRRKLTVSNSCRVGSRWLTGPAKANPIMLPAVLTIRSSTSNRRYEDNVSGKLSDDRFARMSKRYEEEQKELAEKIKALRAEIDKQSSQSMTTDMFISLVRKYTRARKLTPRMLNELIEKIEVFNAEKIDGVWEQRLRIHYNCVGVVEIPELIPLPAPEVSVNTRKGVVVNYAPSTIAG